MVDAQELARRIEIALQEESASLYQKAFAKNSRSYGCSVKGCINDAFAGGLCNAHYIRKRKGKNLLAPLRHRRKDSKCRECGQPVDGKGGWSLCKSHYNKKRRYIIRSVCIEALGGCCAKCDRKYPNHVYDFHHTGDLQKDFPISDAVNKASLQSIAAEVAKCVLLCANCHRIEHYGEE